MTQGCRIDRGSLTIPSLEHTQLQLLTMAKLPVPLGATRKQPEPAPQL